MKQILYLFLLSIVLHGCTISNSKSLETQTPEKINERFFELYGSKGSSEALEFVFSTNEWINENQTSEVKNKPNDLTKQLGAYQGNDLISKRSIGENYILYSFIV